MPEVHMRSFRTVPGNLAGARGKPVLAATIMLMSIGYSAWAIGAAVTQLEPVALAAPLSNDNESTKPAKPTPTNTPSSKPKNDEPKTA
jgi:hypothetical protein